MTSKFKCPVCQNNLHKINVVVSTCTNDKCKLWGSSIPNLVLEALTQSQKDLEESQQATLQNAQTVLEIHKELEIARKALEDIIKERCSFADWVFKAVTMTGIAEKALEQIEHKKNQ